MFFFYNNLDDLKIKDLKFKENYKYTIVHPYKMYEEQTSISEMVQIKVTLEICTVYKSIPYGLAIIKYSHPDDTSLSFRGIGLFDNGKLSYSSFTCLTGDEVGKMFTKMENGRPVDNSYATSFSSKGVKKYVYSLKN